MLKLGMMRRQTGFFLDPTAMFRQRTRLKPLEIATFTNLVPTNTLGPHNHAEDGNGTVQMGNT